VALQPEVDNPIADMLKCVIEKGVTAENASALEKVCDLYEKMDAIGARKAFAAAKSRMQAELPRVMATKGIPSKTGEIRSVFAPYEEIMAVVGPFLTKYGFSVSFTINSGDGRMEAVCILSHSGGHSVENKFSVRVGSGPPGCSEPQADGSARSYARRGALCDCLNIVVDKDDDARMEGAIISGEQANSLKARVKATGITETTFLKLADATSYATIRTYKVPVLERSLEKAEARGAKPRDDEASDSTEPTAAQSRLLDTCVSLSAQAKEKGKDSSPEKILAWATKKVFSEPCELDDLDDDACGRVLTMIAETKPREK